MDTSPSRYIQVPPRGGGVQAWSNYSCVKFPSKWSKIEESQEIMVQRLKSVKVLLIAGQESARARK